MLRIKFARPVYDRRVLALRVICCPFNDIGLNLLRFLWRDLRSTGREPEQRSEPSSGAGSEQRIQNSRPLVRIRLTEHGRDILPKCPRLRRTKYLPQSAGKHRGRSLARGLLIMLECVLWIRGTTPVSVLLKYAAEFI
jgi:hypothetical protein